MTSTYPMGSDCEGVDRLREPCRSPRSCDRGEFQAPSTTTCLAENESSHRPGDKSSRTKPTQRGGPDEFRRQLSYDSVEHTRRVFSLVPPTRYQVYCFCVGRKLPSVASTTSSSSAGRKKKTLEGAFAYLCSSRNALLFYRCVFARTCCSNHLKKSGHDVAVDQSIVRLVLRPEKSFFFVFQKPSKMYGLIHAPSRVDWARNSPGWT